MLSHYPEYQVTVLLFLSLTEAPYNNILKLGICYFHITVINLYDNHDNRVILFYCIIKLVTIQFCNLTIRF